MTPQLSNLRSPERLEMLEKALKVGDSANSLPITQLTGGNGTLCSTGIVPLVGHPGSYLPFVKNGINWAPAQGEDVISYNFTGCIMAVFTQGGVRKVCHVSTGEGQDCKDAWQAIKAQSSQVFEFKPSDFVDT